MGEGTKTPANDFQVKGGRLIKPHSSLASDDAEVKVPKRFYQTRPCRICCGTTTALVLIAVIVLIVLIFTEFKAKDPKIKVTGIALKSFSLKLDSTLTNFQLDVSLHLNVSVYNPNVASFKYSNSSTFLSYRGREVGSAPIPPGKVGAKKTEKLETDLNIHALQIVMDSNLTSDLKAGIIPINTYSSLQGKLNVINVFKHHAVSTSDCSANIMVTNQTLGDFSCDYKIKL